MGRGLQSLDQGRAGAIALELAKFVRGYDDGSPRDSCTVTRWPPSLRARRTSSLKRVLASCRSHRSARGGFGGVVFTLIR